MRINIYLKPDRARELFRSCLEGDKGGEQQQQQQKDGGAGGGVGGLFRRGKKDGSGKRRGVTFEDCLALLRRIGSEINGGRNMADEVFDEVFGRDAGDSVTAEEFLTKFLRAKQGEEDASIDDVRSLFAELNGMNVSTAGRSGGANDDGGGEEEKSDSITIDRSVWGEYLNSARNEVYDPRSRALDSSTLSRPLSEYWINSSHNTYLTGDQLRSSSSVEMYIFAMHRCVVCDCVIDKRVCTHLISPSLHHFGVYLTVDNNLFLQRTTSCGCASRQTKNRMNE